MSLIYISMLFIIYNINYIFYNIMDPTILKIYVFMNIKIMFISSHISSHMKL